jgi:striatin 1/3/4
MTERSLMTCRCLQEVSYLTSPQALNPLPNRPLVSGNLPLALPNLPAFEQMPYNGRPRKVMPDVGKDYPAMNGGGLGAPMTGSAPGQGLSNGQGGPSMERMQGMSPMQTLQPSPSPSDATSASSAPQQAGEPSQLTAIFRPDDGWREQLRIARENAESARHSAGATSPAGGSSWVHDDEGKEEVEDDEDSVVSEGESSKVWKAKRTLRK